MNAISTRAGAETLEMQATAALRSMLFVPGDDPKKLAKARGSGADALIVDLEDAVSPGRKEAARELTLEFLSQPRAHTIYVRINALSSEEAVQDLSRIVRGAPDGIMLPKCSSPDTLQVLDHYLCVMEAREDLSQGAISILPILFEEAKAAFTQGDYGQVSTRLSALMWGVEDLAAEFGSTGRGSDGALLAPFELGRSLCLFAATAAGRPAIDAAYAAFRDLDGLERECRYVEQLGFQGKVAIHPAQIPVINRIFTPDRDAISAAERVIAAFTSESGIGVVGLDGVMLDRPHLLAAQRVIARASAARAEAGGKARD